MATSGRLSAEAMSPVRPLQRLLDKFFDQILAMVSCVCGEPGIDRSGELGPIAIRT